MSNFILVPVCLDALYLEKDQLATEASADFSRLPFMNGKRDINSQNANISEGFVSQPFQNQNLFLNAGIHLHWSLPDALTKGVQDEKGMQFPAVPNRWLVTRTVLENGIKTKTQWVIESDYLYPELDGYEYNAVTIPYPISKKDPPKGKQPFRYLGRKMSLDMWLEEQKEQEKLKKKVAEKGTKALEPHEKINEYLHRLTATGYGEPSFAAFYPNCHSVFGCFDSDFKNGIPKELEYELIGWYADSTMDHVVTFLKDHTSLGAKATALKEELGWELKDQEVPDQMLCYAKLRFDPGNKFENKERTDNKTIVTIANNTAEAWSAWFAYKDSAKENPIVETKLSALQSAGQLDKQASDLAAAFEEQWHKNTFTSQPSGTVWEVNSQTLPDQGERAKQKTWQTALSHELINALNELNALQRQYDWAWHRIEAMQKQLFVDWYKYMVCNYPPFGYNPSDYPDIDEVRHFILQKDIKPLKQLKAATGQLKTEGSSESENEKNAAKSKRENISVADRLTQAKEKLLKQINNFNQSKDAQELGKFLVLKSVENEPFHQPNEPLVLLTGDAVQNSSKRHGRTGPLPCRFLSKTNLGKLIKEDFAAVRDELAKLDADDPGFRIWKEQPWNPIVLEWRASVFPLQHKSNHTAIDKVYANDFITDNYQIDAKQVELTIQDGKGAIAPDHVKTYQGATILATKVQSTLKTQLGHYLLKVIANSSIAGSFAQLEEKDLKDKIKEIKKEYKQTSNADETALFFMDCYKDLCDTNCLAQTLGGFNDALLMQKHTMLLEIADPLAFKSDLDFTNIQVREQVGNSIINAPEPNSNFDPIRTGALKINALRLVDTFGQVKDLDISKVLSPNHMHVPSSRYLVKLPPRLTMPARLKPTWLRAKDGKFSLNQHMENNPICGWLLPNYVDNSLGCYDQDGKAIGVFDREGNWKTFPGKEKISIQKDIDNPYLQQVLAYFKRQDATFFETFFGMLDQAQHHQLNSSEEQDSDWSHLFANPIAIARLCLQFDVKGQPAGRNDWNTFRLDMKRSSRNNDNFNYVNFPVLLGQAQNLGDGLISYWMESENGKMGKHCISPFIAEGTQQVLQHPNEQPLTLSIDNARQNLTVLIDPRLPIKIKTGILPVLSAKLAPSLYRNAMDEIEAQFLTAPLLNVSGKLAIPLPQTGDYQWSWVERHEKGWIERHANGLLSKDVFEKVFPQPTQLWPQLLEKGWLEEVDEQHARIVEKAVRKSPVLDPQWAAHGSKIEFLLGAACLVPTEQEAQPEGPTEIREGWLKLSHHTTT